MIYKKNFTDSDGFKLLSLSAGNGIPLFVIGSALFYSRAFSDELQNHFRMVFADHRGFTENPYNDGDISRYSMNILLEDIDKVRITEGLDKFIILGHSGHAFMALEYAKKYPENILGVVMTGVSPDYSENNRLKCEEFFNEKAGQKRKDVYSGMMSELMAKIAREPEKRFLHFCLCSGARNWYDPEYDASWLWEGVTTNMEMIDHVWGVIFRDIKTEEGLQQLDKPVFLSTGRFDFVTGPATRWEKYKPLFRNLTFKVYENSCHYPMIDNREEFNNDLIMWKESI